MGDSVSLLEDLTSLQEDAREDFVSLPENATEDLFSLSEDVMEDSAWVLEYSPTGNFHSVPVDSILLEDSLLPVDLEDALEDFILSEDGLTGRSDPVPVDSSLSEDSLLSTGFEDLLFAEEVNSELLEQEEIESHMKKIIVLDDAEVCSVCLQDIDVGAENVTVLSCNSHIFHKKCVDEWSKRKPNCPLCRHDMREERQRNLKRKRLPYDDDEELTRLKL